MEMRKFGLVLFGAYLLSLFAVEIVSAEENNTIEWTVKLSRKGGEHCKRDSFLMITKDAVVETNFDVAWCIPEIIKDEILTRLQAKSIEDLEGKEFQADSDIPTPLVLEKMTELIKNLREVYLKKIKTKKLDMSI
jgi:hypothetical protein